ncbi:MAG TPA: hypothetical protein VJ696_10810, partial [Rhodanobacteraceae bacterium]|nr:hypothetical protein [Rhodanobacteraceae bacterium]
MPARLLAALIAVAAARCAAAAAPHYRLRYDAAGETMAVRLCLPDAASNVRFDADEAAPRFIDELKREHGAIERHDDGWSAAGWQAGECLSYRAALGRIADSGRRMAGARHGGDLVLDPSLWLLRVEDAGEDPATADVALASGYSISAPWHPAGRDGETLRFTIPNTPEDWMARVAIGRFVEAPIALPGGTLRFSILSGADVAERNKLAEWISHVSRAALSAYGKLPLADVQLLMVPVRGEREPVGFGQSTRGEGHALTLFVDPTQPVEAFDRDWVAVHELSHLFHPYLGDRGSWLAEGLATYYQNVLRARAGLLTPAQAWEQIDAGFARGRSATSSGAPELERASASMGERHDFMRIYWSGTAYWLEVDAQLRRASGNRLGIDEALRRFDACCLPSYR